MKRALIVSTLLIAGAIPAMAADLPVKAPPPLAVPIYNWTGFYVGLNGGYSWGRSGRTLEFFNAATGALIVPPIGTGATSDPNLEGGVFGGQIGYNWQSANWLFGLETDLQWTNQRGSSIFTCLGVVGGGACLPGLTFLPPGGGTTAIVDQRIEWFGTFRGRVGALVTPTMLLYATGGAAYGDIKTDVAVAGFTPAGAPISFTGSSTDTRLGWTVGGGFEWGFIRNWSAKIEYLYMDLGTVSSQATLVTGPLGVGVGARLSSRITDHILRGGINYRF